MSEASSLLVYIILNVCIYMYFHSFKALKNQYPSKDGYIIADHKYFHFMECEAVPLKITVADDDAKYIVAKDPSIAEVAI